MNKGFKSVLIAGLCSAVMGVSLLGGCAGTNAALDDETAKNRQFMASVNQVMVDIQSSLDGFNDAVGAGDVVAMKTQLDNTADCLDALGKIEAPAGLGDIKQDYVDGTTALQNALGDYITLFFLFLPAAFFLFLLFLPAAFLLFFLFSSIFAVIPK